MIDFGCCLIPTFHFLGLFNFYTIQNDRENFCHKIKFRLQINGLISKLVCGLIVDSAYVVSDLFGCAPILTSCTSGDGPDMKMEATIFVYILFLCNLFFFIYLLNIRIQLRLLK